MTSHFEPGHVIANRFCIKQMLAFGGMGSVYEVEDITIGRAYVLKTLHGELGGDCELRRQMHQEARVLGRIDHVNVVRVFTAGVTDDDQHLPYIVMEKLEGASLRQILRAGGRIPTRAAVRAVIDLLHALDHVHEMGIVHCDLKPENVFFHKDRHGVTPKLLDFGVVRVLPRGEANAKLGGTLRYASPEQIKGEGVGPRSDVYSMALVLYEMLAGVSPFRDATGTSAIVRAQLCRTPAPIAGLPSGLMRLLQRALAKEPAMRPRDAFAFARELGDVERTLEGEREVDAKLLTARAKCDERTRRGEMPAPADLSTRVKEEATRVKEEEEAADDTVRDLTTMISDGDLETRGAIAERVEGAGVSGAEPLTEKPRYATWDVDGGGGLCDGFRP